MDRSLNEVERDFIAFIAERKGRTREDVATQYLKTKRKFKFGGLDYRQLVDDFHNLNAMKYGDGSDEEIVAAMRFHELAHLYRFMSYADPSGEGFMDLARVGTSLLLRGDFERIRTGVEQFRARRKEAPHRQTPAQAAREILANVPAPRSVIDYGCGLGYISYEIGRLDPDATFYLLDIDCMTLDFAEYRFRQRGLAVSTIPVTEDDIYPKLPQHNVCVATEVLEHVREPATAYQHIMDSLDTGGILYGDFGHHHEEMFHVSPDLQGVGARIASDFEQLSHLCYRRR